MRAIGGASSLRRLSVGGVGVLLCCCTLAAYLATDISAKTHATGADPTTFQHAHSAQFKCKVLFVPCVGPIDTIFYMDGLSNGDTKLLWVTRPTKGTTKRVPKGELEKQSFACHTAPKVKLVAVFTARTWESSRGHIRATHTRVPFGPHSCHGTLTWLREANDLTGPNASPPSLILEGKLAG